MSASDAQPTGRTLGRAALIAAAVVGLTFSVVVGLAALAVDVPGLVRSVPVGDWAVDGRRHLAAADALRTGADPYRVDGYLYSPLGTWAMVPFAILGTSAGLVAFFVVRVALLLWFLADSTTGWAPLRRLAAGLVVVTWVFVLDDLWMGNVSILIVCATWLAISRDRVPAGIPLGIVMATVAKPLLLPFLLWLLVYRRRGLAGALVTAAAVTLLATVFLGPASYLAYLGALATASRTVWVFPGNLGLSASAPQLVLPVSLLVMALYAGLLWRSRDEAAVLLWSLLVGLIAAPYAPLYAPVPVLAGLFPFVRAHPLRTAAMAAIVIPLAFFNLILATVVALVLAVPTDVIPFVDVPRPDGAAVTPPRGMPTE